MSIQAGIGSRDQKQAIERSTNDIQILMPRATKKHIREAEGAVPAQELQQQFPRIALPIRPPFPPMEAKLVPEIPIGKGWLYEPKWDGFRCLAFRSGDEVLLQSKAGQPLARYFPELVRALRKLAARKFVLDGEIVIIRDGQLSFDDLLMRIHPAESRIRKLSEETPVTYLLFDLLVDERGKALFRMPLGDRREKLEEFYEHFAEAAARAATRPRMSRERTPSRRFTQNHSRREIAVSPATVEAKEALRWMQVLASSGFDGVVAKRLDLPYQAGERTGMQKIKRIRSADCVVGGFRYAQKGGEIGSLLLGLYNKAGRLDHVGFTSSFSRDGRRALKEVVLPVRGGEGFNGNAPGGPSRWSTRRSGEWEPLKPGLVCEVLYDHFSGGRFRHGTKFLRWRPDKDPRQCTLDQVRPTRRAPALEEFGLAA